MTNLDWIKEMLPEENGWIHGCIAFALDKQDNIIKQKTEKINQLENAVVNLIKLLEKQDYYNDKIIDNARKTLTEKKDC